MFSIGCSRSFKQIHEESAQTKEAVCLCFLLRCRCACVDLAGIAASGRGGCRDDGFALAHSGHYTIGVHGSNGRVAAGPGNAYGSRVCHCNICRQNSLPADRFQVQAGFIQAHTADIILDSDRAGQCIATVCTCVDRCNTFLQAGHHAVAVNRCNGGIAAALLINAVKGFCVREIELRLGLGVVVLDIQIEIAGVEVALLFLCYRDKAAAHRTAIGAGRNDGGAGAPCGNITVAVYGGNIHVAAGPGDGAVKVLYVDHADVAARISTAGGELKIKFIFIKENISVVTIPMKSV